MRKSKKNINFIYFSVGLFLIISLVAIIAYLLAARQTNRTYAQQQLFISGESVNLQLTIKISNELALLTKIGHSRIIKEYFLQPNDQLIKSYALSELELFQQYSSEGLVFWINDIDRVFHTSRTEPYIVNPNLPENYWYNLTLYSTTDFNFNINYNNELANLYLWINVPIFDTTQDGIKKPIGMLGAGLNIPSIIELVESTQTEMSRYITSYLFNKSHEITIAHDVELIKNKVLLSGHLGDAGQEAIRRVKSIVKDTPLSYIYEDKIYLLCKVPAIKDWSMLLCYPLPGIFSMNQTNNFVFFGMLFLILALIIIINIFVAQSNKQHEKQNRKLISTNERLNILVQATRIGIWDAEITSGDYLNPNNVYNWSNEFRQMLGYTDEIDFPNTLGSWIERLHPDDKEKTLQHFIEHFRHQDRYNSYEIEYRLQKKDQTFSYYRAYGGIILDENNNPIRFVGCIVDMTITKNILLDSERQRISTTEANNRLNMIVQATQIGVWDADLSIGDYTNPSNIFNWSPEFRQLLGFSDETEFPNVLGSWINRLHPEDKEATLSCLVEHFRDRTDNTKYQVEFRLLKKDNQYSYYRAYGGTLRNDQGIPLRFVGCLVDMSITKNLLLDLEKQKIKALEANDKLNMVIRAANIGLWEIELYNSTLTNPLTTYIWSDEFRQMLGYEDEQDFPNHSNSWIDALHPDEREEARSHIRNHVNDKTNNTPYDTEFRLKHKNGEYMYFRAYGGTFRDEQGNAIRMVGMLMDITESKKMLIALENQRTRAETANKAKSDFLAKISHEIRTPMNAIIGIAQIQLQKPVLQDDYKQSIEKIYNAGANLLGIINDILDLSKMESGKMEIIPVEYDLPSLLNDTVQLNFLQIGSKSIEFILELDENLPSRLIGDELRIKQIINNLLSNAIKYTAKGFVKLRVFSKLSEDNKDDLYLHFIVEDSGQGMKPEDCKKLFAEYLRFNMSVNRVTQGTGIGLNITKNLVELMNGMITVESEFGKGSTFSCEIKQKIIDYIPIGKELAKQLCSFTFSANKQLSSLKILRESMPYGKVLIVDDVETNLFVAQGLLAPYQLQIETAISGELTLEKIKKGKIYDVIFMDHMMPEMDGIETTRILRAIGYKGTIVALTANAISGNAEMFKQNGFDDFISKPIDVRALNAILNNYVREKNKSGINSRLPLEDEEEVAKKNLLQPKLLDVFRKDAIKAIATIKDTVENGNIRLFTTTVHAMKSLLSVINETDTAKIASALENAGHKGDIQYITTNYGVLIGLLESLVKKICSENNDMVDDESIQEDTEYLFEQYHFIISACEKSDDATVYKTIELLKKKCWKKNTFKTFDQINDLLFLNSDFEGVINLIKNVMI